MEIQPIWVSTQDHLSHSYLYHQLLNLLENEDELRGFVQASGCGSSHCKSGQGCCHGK